MKPEEKARIIIDRMLNDAGWEVVDRNHYSPEVSAIAVEEGLLKGNREADYLLFLNGKAVGVLEAKKESVSIYSEIVADQAEKYTRGVPHWCQACFEDRRNCNILCLLSRRKSSWSRRFSRPVKLILNIFL